MKLGLGFGLAGIIMLGMMIGAGGCARKPVETAKAPRPKLPTKLTIGSRITIKGGHQGLDKVELTIERFPSSASGPGPIVMPLTVSPGPAVTPEQEALLTITMSVETAVGTGDAEAIIVKLAPPSGWKATPKEYRLTQDNKHADFKLEKVGETGK